MRNIAILFLLALSINASAQKLGISYFGHYAILPGAKLSYQLTPSSLELAKKPLILQPEVGWFMEPDNYHDFLFNVNVGQQIKNVNKKSYWSYGLGLGYILESKITSFSQNLGNGNRENVERDTFHFFHPSANFGWHSNISSKSDLFLKYTLGYKMLSEAPSVLTMFLEFGIEIDLKKRSDE